MKRAFCMLVLVAWSSLFLPALLAQQPGLVRGTVEDPSGIHVAEAAKLAASTVTGVVEDRTGSVIPEVDVTLVAQTNGEKLKTVTDQAGQFVFTQVPRGEYLLRVNMQGFEKVELEVKVGTAPITAKKVRLELANVEDEITVSARATSDPLAPDHNATAFVLEHDLLKRLPRKNEEPLSIASLFVDHADSG